MRAIGVLGAAAAISLTSACTTTAPTPGDAGELTARPVRILLTDDDGWDAAGITAMRRALERAGHDVTLVAPASDQSGNGAGSSGSDQLEPRGRATYSVDGTPVDAVRAGMAMMRAQGRPPELVVSGANLGRNTGSSIESSGTVGAAVAAGRAGVPAIAASTDDGQDESDCTPTADYVARVVGALSAATPLMAPGLVLNINYPKGEQATEVVFRPRLVVDVDGDSMSVSAPGGSHGGGDGDLLADGKATVAELDVDGRPGELPSPADRIRAAGA